MSNTNQASDPQEHAASEHEAAAKHHRKVAECHDQNKLSDAKASSKSAMDCCHTAQKHSATACECSAKQLRKDAPGSPFAEGFFFAHRRRN